MKLVLAMLAAAAALGAERTDLFWLDGAKTEFVTLYNGRLLISKGCLKSGKLDCEARRKSLSASMAQVKPEELPEGKRAGSVICAHQGGEVVIGRDASHNQNAFCVFKDKSAVDIGSLEYYARTMDELHKRHRERRHAK